MVAKGQIKVKQQQDTTGVMQMERNSSVQTNKRKKRGDAKLLRMCH